MLSKHFKSVLVTRVHQGTIPKIAANNAAAFVSQRVRATLLRLPYWIITDASRLAFLLRCTRPPVLFCYRWMLMACLTE